MNKTIRILQLVNLLYHRQYVTPRMIKETCNIPDRTVFRYMNTISEANIPVYFDRQRRSYTLTRHSTVTLEDLTLNESVLTLVALKALLRVVDGEYQSDIKQLITKTLVRQASNVESVLPLIEKEFDAVEEWPDLTRTISSTLVNAAVISNRPLRIQVGEDGQELEETQIESPALAFKGEWRLQDRSSPESSPAKLSAIRKAEIV